jgi:5,10-methenyltetrahydrofolate synthetase
MVADKRALRHEHLTARRALDADERRRISSAVVERLRALDELLERLGRASTDGPATLLLYAAQPDEVDLAALITEAPGDARVLLPRVVGDSLELVAHGASDPLIPGAFGVREPAGDTAVAPDEVDIAIVPGVAFGVDGTRLGRGGGFYDRLLPRLRADCLVIGVCPEQAVLTVLPTEAHDRAVDIVVTDASVRRRTTTADPAPA